VNRRTSSTRFVLYSINADQCKTVIHRKKFRSENDDSTFSNIASSAFCISCYLFLVFHMLDRDVVLLLEKSR
jgi:hypothetical protein